MTDTTDDAVREWEAHVYEFLDEPIPDAIRAHAATTVGDILCAAVAGSAVPGVDAVEATGEFGDGPATVLGTDRTTTPEAAALCNGAAAIAQETDEGHDTGGHVGAGIVAGGLAAAEAADVHGSTFVDACTRSYELCVRLERAIFAMKARLNEATPWLLRDPHSTWTVVGPALTAAQCFGATADELRETFRIAANLAVLSMHDPYDEGPPARNFTAGFSAQVGVSAARTALAGLTGSESAIGAVYDPFDAMLPDSEFADSFESLGERWEITRNYFKPYPSCRYTHPPLDALRAAVERDRASTVEPAGSGGETRRRIDPAAIESIEIETFANATDMSNPTPESFTAAKFSTPYVLARYLRSGELGLSHFTPDAIADPTVRELAERVRLVGSERFEDAFPEKWGAAATVRLADGTVHSGERSFPTGDHRDPMDEAALRTRQRELLLEGLSETETTAALDAITTVDDRPVREITDALRSETA
ncbi:MmgE/PrpD family protein [Halococcus sediminicola]|uniref:MmgE/PrpD family protein n=1 Tax=Halococcus sediminicola TaxID=1264579 RepID=UPI00067942AA|nr:MmgE/PrpD family protein [Halococcus sediminicola]